ncbi:Pentatricopeptide repeat-containing protein [Acorus calamus]|uniref:Pentatricopeptide repeat-containing protein n=1 Tax=Acorus calamus TaxID=4465 RepID=A0AAV9DDR0_ACOCL|nr:Pentatricopeptide repeat-containing protein [Acorus calamus]
MKENNGTWIVSRRNPTDPLTKLGWYNQFFDLEKNYSHRLRICANNGDTNTGRSLHSSIIKTIPRPPVFLHNSLANMYSKWGLMDHARRVFDEIPQPDVVSWNTMINGYFSSGSDSLSFDWFLKMVSCGVVPDEFGSSAVLKACSGLGDVCGGARVHCVAIKSGICGSAFVGCGLVEFYAGFGFYEDSMRIFDEMDFKDVVLVNAVIGVQAKIGHIGGAFLNFRWMLSSSMAPARASFVNLMMAVINGSCGDLRPGEQVHGLVVKSGFEGDGVIENSLVRMYTSCGSVDGGFDLLVHSGSNNLMSWTTLISGCADHGCFRVAMEAFCWIFGEAFSVDCVLILAFLEFPLWLGA